MFNKVILVGNLTRDIELRYTSSGTAVSGTAIATSRKFKAQDGTQREEVCFIDITFFGRTAEIANQYLRKGSKVLVEGRLKLEQWSDQNGQKRSKHSVTVETLQMLGSREEGTQQGYSQSYSNSNQKFEQPTTYQEPKSRQHVKEESIPEINIDEDEIPF